MTCPAGRRTALVVVALLAVGITVGASGRAQDVSTARKAMVPDTILYGVAYYHEYMPYERLDKDIELMKRAGHHRRARGRVHLDELGAARGRVPVRLDGPHRGQDARGRASRS